MHHVLDLVIDDGVEGALKEGLSSLLLNFDYFLNHGRHLLLVDLKLVLSRVLLHVGDYRVADRVHVDKYSRDELVVDEGLTEEEATIVSDHVVAQVESPDLEVLLEEFSKGLDRVRGHLVLL